MSADPFRDGLLEAIPHLRAFALSLTHDRDLADDLVQDTLTRAWAYRDRFETGTNLGAWLFTILRNLLYSEHRKRVRQVDDPDGTYAASQLKTHPEQQSHLDMEDLLSALQRLPTDQREALLLIAAEGMSYEEAGAIIGVPEGTVKSRVFRAREKLAALLHLESEEDIGLDPVVQAALQAE